MITMTGIDRSGMIYDQYSGWEKFETFKAKNKKNYPADFSEADWKKEWNVMKEECGL